MKPLIYAVEDEESIRDLYTCALESANMDCGVFETGAALFDALKVKLPDLIIVDLMLPDTDGLQILKQLKSTAETSFVPAIIVSAKGDEISKVKGLNGGADDYLSKPFSVLELIARIKANIRKSGGARAEASQETSALYLDEGAHKAYFRDTELNLTLKEYDLLKLLLSRPDAVFKRDEILDKVWGFDYLGETRTLDMHIKTLRRKIELAGGSAQLIRTVRGVGYLLESGAND